MGITLREVIESLRKDVTNNPKSRGRVHRQIQNAFVEMLNRVGGGFKFTDWIEPSKVSGDERSALAVLTDTDWCAALYGSDHKYDSHIVAYVGLIRFERTVRIQAEITFYEGGGHDPISKISFTFGEKLSSTSLIADLKGHHHKGISDALEALLGLIEAFNKSFYDF